MVMEGLGKRVSDLICPRCGGRLGTIYGYARCTNPECDFISKYSRDEQIAPETPGILKGLIGKRANRRKFQWDQPLDFVEVKEE